jgi:hypothetical protein
MRYECQGIGVGAKCGDTATIRTASHKWNAATESMDDIEVWFCPRHAAELQIAMANKRRCITPNHGSA